MLKEKQNAKSRFFFSVYYTAWVRRCQGFPHDRFYMFFDKKSLYNPPGLCYNKRTPKTSSALRSGIPILKRRDAESDTEQADKVRIIREACFCTDICNAEPAFEKNTGIGEPLGFKIHLR